MEQLTANMSRAKVQRRTVHGREFLVAPITILAPGVLNGSKGALYYPPEEIARNHADWNGIPILINHSVVNGQSVSGRDPKVWESQGVGHVYNSRITRDGRQVVDGYFDAAALKRVSTDVYNRILKGEPVSVSTGLFTQNEPAKGSDHKGRTYQYIARGYKPDHLAILPDQPGACSIQDGCGVLLNSAVMNGSPDQPRDENGRWTDTISEVSVKKLADKASKDLEGRLKSAPAHAEFQRRISEVQKRVKEGKAKPEEELDTRWKAFGELKDQLRKEKLAAGSEIGKGHNFVSVAIQGSKSSDAGMKDVHFKITKPAIELRSSKGWQALGSYFAGRYEQEHDELLTPASGSRPAAFVMAKSPKDAKTAAVKIQNLFRQGGLKGEVGVAGSHVVVIRQSNVEHPDKEKFLSAVAKESKHSSKSGHGDRRNLTPSEHKLVGAWLGYPTADVAKYVSNRNTCELALNQYDKTQTNGGRQMTPEQKKEIVDGLISNCDCGWSEEDRETLNGFSDEKLTAMDAYRKTSVRNAELVANAEEMVQKGLMDDEEEEPACNEEEDPGCTERMKQKDVATNAEQWLAAAPESIRNELADAREIIAREKQSLIDALTANVKDKEPVVNALKDKSLADLRVLQALAPPYKAPPVNYAGAAGRAPVTNAPVTIAPLASPDNYLL